ncbi:MAG TPA: SDR family NAD(P)-dependent oxidoreductase [bacterium]|nr:SDR family NAD(P)-dependent oxidoreductase [bacterium]
MTPRTPVGRAKVALVFGASTGIGRATAFELSRAGFAVGVAARSLDVLKEVAAKLEAQGAQAEAIGVDVAERAQVDAAVRRVVDRWHGLDVVVNSAGTNLMRQRRIDVISEADWNGLLAVNLNGAFHTTQAAVLEMRHRGGGLIIQISSVSGRWGDKSGPAYQASKHGIIGVCQATMIEERLNGIRATAILPGLVDTPLIARRPEPVPREILAQAMQPEDIAAACVFLASLSPRSYIPELIMMPPRLQCIGQAIV